MTKKELHMDKKAIKSVNNMDMNLHENKIQSFHENQKQLDKANRI